MERRQAPVLGEPDMAARVTEARMAERGRGHEARNAREARA